MSETIGAFTVDTAEGVLLPALGIIKTSVDPAPPTYYAGQAVGIESPIKSARAFTTPTLALAAALSYATYIGQVVLFRGVSCFVADVEIDHQAMKIEGREAVATATWKLVASPGWVP
jgi:hypothetical protein